MNHMSLGDLDTARVDIKRTHEREAIIAEFRAKETAQAEAGNSKKARGINTQTIVLSDYPVELLNDPEVVALRTAIRTRSVTTSQDMCVNLE